MIIFIIIENGIKTYFVDGKYENELVMKFNELKRGNDYT